MKKILIGLTLAAVAVVALAQTRLADLVELTALAAGDMVLVYDARSGQERKFRIGYPVSPGEVAVGIGEPEDIRYPVGDIRRYGTNTSPGTTDMTAALQNAIRAAAADGVCVEGFKRLEVYAIGNIAMASATSTIPACFDGNMAIFKARPGTRGDLFTIRTPQGRGNNGFRFENAIIDGNAIAVPLRIDGSQRSIYGNLWVRNSAGDGMVFESEYPTNEGGIYYNQFYSILSGGYGYSNVGDGFKWQANSPPNVTFQNNTLTALYAQYNRGDGFDIRLATLLCNGCGAEKNNGKGVRTSTVPGVTFVGGFTENNDQNRATDADMNGFSDNVSDGSQDESFEIEAGTNGLKVIGGRHIGDFAGPATFATGNWFMPDNFTQFGSLILDEQGRLRLNAVLIDTGGGIAYAGEPAVANTQNWIDGHCIDVAGRCVIQIHDDAHTSPGQTNLIVRHNAGGTPGAARVTVDAADSCGSGYRCLRIPN